MAEGDGGGSWEVEPIVLMVEPYAQGLRLDPRNLDMGEDYWCIGMHRPGVEDQCPSHARWHAWVALAHEIIRRDMERIGEGGS